MKRTLLRMSMITMIFMTLAMCQNKGSIVMSEKNIENAVVGGGCFWCCHYPNFLSLSAQTFALPDFLNLSVGKNIAISCSSSSIGITFLIM